jgi:hypothetical protein
VELKQVDDIDAKPLQRCLAVRADGVRSKVGSWWKITTVPAAAAFREDERSPAAEKLEGLAHEFLRVAVAVNGRRVNPIHTAIEGMEYGGNRLSITLGGTGVCPTRSADGPGAEANPADRV